MKALKDTLMNRKNVVRNLVMVLIAGVILLVLVKAFPGISEQNPGFSAAPSPVSSVTDGISRTPLHTLEQRLEDILSLVAGAGEVRVLIHETRSAETVYARNATLDETKLSETDANGGTREQNQQKTTDAIVTLNRREGGNEPLILYENAPKIEGVIIVAEGGGNLFVRDALIRAASATLGVAIHKISVLEMAK
jgi:stage III sporulation protein AG